MKRFTVLVVAAIVMLAGPNAFAAERLQTALSGAPAGSTATYTVILYGGTYFNDPEAAAILDIENDGYTIEPRAPEFNYRVLSGLAADKALGEARAHLGSHRSFMNAVLRSINDRSGVVIGYELIPRYGPLLYGRSDVVESNYYADKSGKVNAYIRIDPFVEDQIMFSGGGDGGGRY